MLEEFLDTNAHLFTDDYLVIKIDTEAMVHGEQTANRLRGVRTGGIPWMTILDADGRELITSDGPNGNIGCPITVEECDYFISMIEQTTRHAPSSRMEEIAAALDVHAQKRR